MSFPPYPLLCDIYVFILIYHCSFLYKAHYSVFFSLPYENQIRKEAEKTAVTKVVVAADKAKEQELKARTREVITTKQEQVHVTHEQVKMVFDMKLLLLSVST